VIKYLLEAQQRKDCTSDQHSIDNDPASRKTDQEDIS
jgi:hypothetical protein